MLFWEYSVLPLAMLEMCDHVPVVITAASGGLGSTAGKLTTNAGSQIGVAVSSRSDSTINATFTISSSAAAQSYSVVTTNSSGASCSG